ncbi:MAG: hypothetical protein IT385_09630 [Deltaproteobacteria bacterium]|nr:hypothetical protein [Deltaproteobacteria bacterium]
MQLPLDIHEARELETALSNHLLEMRTERVHTDSRAFRHELAESIERLEAVTSRLSELIRQAT